MSYEPSNEVVHSYSCSYGDPGQLPNLNEINKITRIMKPDGSKFLFHGCKELRKRSALTALASVATAVVTNMRLNPIINSMTNAAPALPLGTVTPSPNMG